MDRKTYEKYIERFNAEDPTVFDEYISPDMKMLNGALEYRGISGMKDHYGRKVWPYFTEKLSILGFVSDADTLAVRLWTHFTARDEAINTLFGPVRAGETFDYRGVVFYEIGKGKFSSIIVAYNSFIHTDIRGRKTNLGIPH